MQTRHADVGDQLHLRASAVAVFAASRATGMSLVPAVRITTRPIGVGGFVGSQNVRAVRSC